MKRSLKLLCSAAGLALVGCATRAPEVVEPTSGGARVVPVVAKRFEYSPSVVHLKKGEPVVLALSSLDCTHGFDSPKLSLHAKIVPGVGARIPFTPNEAGHFAFHCDVFCGDGHEDMTGEIDVDD